MAGLHSYWFPTTDLVGHTEMMSRLGDERGRAAFADREGEPLSVRVGLNAGEPIEEDGE